MRILLTALLAFTLTGCATTGKNDQAMMSRLQLRVGELERELDRKQEQINDLTYTIKDLSYEMDRLKASSAKREVKTTISSTTKEYIERSEDGIIRVSASTEDVQRALKNAGYYQGDVDNKIGNKTKSAISKFQKDNGLNADGIVGEKTWDQLKSFLE